MIGIMDKSGIWNFEHKEKKIIIADETIDDFNNIYGINAIKMAEKSIDIFTQQQLLFNSVTIHAIKSLQGNIFKVVPV